MMAYEKQTTIPLCGIYKNYFEKYDILQLHCSTYSLIHMAIKILFTFQ